MPEVPEIPEVPEVPEGLSPVQAYPESMLKPLSEWHHIATNSYHLVIGIGRCSTNGPNVNKERCVIYWSETLRELRYREINEFLDGRFEPLDPSRKPLIVVGSESGSE